MTDARWGGLDPGRGGGVVQRTVEIRLFEDEVMKLLQPEPGSSFRASLPGAGGGLRGRVLRAAGGRHDVCTYRGHGAVLAMGAPLDRAFGEILGKAHGLCRRQGRLDAPRRRLASARSGRNAIVGAAPADRLRRGARGAAPRHATTSRVVLLRRRRGEQRRLPRGAEHRRGLEAAGGLRLREQPLRRVLARSRRPRRSADLADRAGAYAMPRRAGRRQRRAARVRTAIATAVDARAAPATGPTLIEAKTYRYKGHSRTDPAKYRPAGRARALAGRATRSRRSSADARRARGVAVDGDRAMRRSRRRSVAATRSSGRWAGPSRTPTGRVCEDVLRVSETDLPGGRRPRARDELRARPRVVLLGEDIGAAGGVFKATEGLFERFGGERVRDTPISEQAIVGTAIGAAMTGLRPVAEIMFADFAGVCFDQIANQLAKYRYMTGGQATRAGRPSAWPTAAGAGLRRAALADGRELVLERSRVETLRAGHAGGRLRLLRAAIRADDPVLVLRAQSTLWDHGRARRTAIRCRSGRPSRSHRVGCDGGCNAADAPSRRGGSRGAGGGRRPAS